MEMKPLDNGMKYALIFTDSIHTQPHVHGYSDKERRDNVYMEYIETGKLTISDENLDGVSQTLEPVYVARMDFVDGAVNNTKVIEELGGLSNE